ncbi:MAG: hypothetical protein F6K16_02825 [Symploca sp. SIO2B6]|nr:hypothetical protein [Symploca sp. SIO2B6]
MSPEQFLSSTIWVARMKTYFKVMDVDKNGVLSLSDFEAIADRISQLQDNSSKPEEIRELFRSLYQNVVAGGAAVDSNTMIGEEEFLGNAAKAVTLVESTPEVGRRKNEVFFDLIDTDHSGKISREEYRKYLAIYSGGDDPNRASQAFDSIDVDGTGSIGREEFIEGHMRYWFEDGSDQSFSPLPYGPLVDS